MVEVTGLDSRAEALGRSRSKQSTGLFLCTARPSSPAEFHEKNRRSKHIVLNAFFGRADTSKSELSADSSFNSSNVTVFVPS